MKAPEFWWQQSGIRAGLLSPLAALYGMVADRPFGRGHVSDIPVLCIGNFVVGGAGKTPLALALADRIMAHGGRPVFLSRGYGGTESGPYQVDIERDSARKVGDEPLLLANQAPTFIAHDRIAALSAISAFGAADVIIMDDGFQSARIKPQHAMLVIDAARGLGNGQVLPAGPLRARLATQILHADSLVVLGYNDSRAPSTDALIGRFHHLGKPVFDAMLAPQGPMMLEERVLAYSGIGDPEKFFRSLREGGMDVIHEVAFPDHHFFSQDDARTLLDLAAGHQAALVTTAKDFARLRGETGALARLAAVSHVFRIEVAFAQPSAVDALLQTLEGSIRLC